MRNKKKKQRKQKIQLLLLLLFLYTKLSLYALKFSLVSIPIIVLFNLSSKFNFEIDDRIMKVHNTLHLVLTDFQWYEINNHVEQSIYKVQKYKNIQKWNNTEKWCFMRTCKLVNAESWDIFAFVFLHGKKFLDTSFFFHRML